MTPFRPHSRSNADSGSQGVSTVDPSELPSFAPEILTPREIRELRQRCQLTQQALARKLNVSRETIVRWEGGKQTPNPVYVELLRKVERETLQKHDASIPPTSISEPILDESLLKGTCPICGKRPLRPLPVRYAIPTAQQQGAESGGGVLAFQCINEHVFFVMARDLKEEE
jgi:DNA-binding transcriptional regulator YiaG